MYLSATRRRRTACWGARVELLRLEPGNAPKMPQGAFDSFGLGQDRGAINERPSGVPAVPIVPATAGRQGREGRLSAGSTDRDLSPPVVAGHASADYLDPV
jgi:hypothetical protein